MKLCSARMQVQVDNYATHAGESVDVGEKWVATRWIREDTFT